MILLYFSNISDFLRGSVTNKHENIRQKKCSTNNQIQTNTHTRFPAMLGLNSGLVILSKIEIVASEVCICIYCIYIHVCIQDIYCIYIVYIYDFVCVCIQAYIHYTHTYTPTNTHSQTHKSDLTFSLSTESVIVNRSVCVCLCVCVCVCVGLCVCVCVCTSTGLDVFAVNGVVQRQSGRARGRACKRDVYHHSTRRPGSAWTRKPKPYSLNPEPWPLNV